MRLSYESDNGAANRARLAVIVLQVDETLEYEFRTLLNIPGVALHHSRVPSGLDVTEETLAAMERHIPRAVALLPAGAPFDTIGYACTSGASVIGPENVALAVRSAYPTSSQNVPEAPAVTDPLTAVRAACNFLGIRRLGFVSPYVAEVSEHLRMNLEAHGLTITAFGSFEESEERKVARISPESVYQAILQVGRSSPCDAVFVSCTNLRTLDILERAEVSLGKPVISSNQALAWHMLRISGINDPIPGYGRLLRLGLTPDAETAKTGPATALKGA
ncbi:maleate cis-trans isomerase family protein [Arthrobacter sp. RHLT1-20]